MGFTEACELAGQIKTRAPLQQGPQEKTCPPPSTFTETTTLLQRKADRMLVDYDAGGLAVTITPCSFIRSVLLEV